MTSTSIAKNVGSEVASRNTSTKKPSFYIDFTQGNAGGFGQLVTTRTGNAWGFNRQGLLTTFAANTPLYDHDLLGTPLGLRSDTAGVNNAISSRDLSSNITWVKLNTTHSSSTGLDGVASSGSRITASANNGTVLQSLVLSSAPYCFSAYIKRVTGSGNIDITIDGGLSWTTVQAFTDRWVRVFVTATILNPSFGFRLATSGDAVDIDVCQLEAGTVPTSPIVTTSGAVTRNPTNYSIAPVGGYIKSSGFTWQTDVVFYAIPAAPVGGVIYAFNVNSNNSTRLFFSTSAMRVLSRTNSVTDGSILVENAPSIFTLRRYAFAQENNRLVSAVNGVLGTTDTSVVTPLDFTSLIVGRDDTNQYLQGWIQRIAYYDFCARDHDLINMTM